MKININKIQYYRENPLAFLEEICNIKLLPYQKYYLNKIWNSEATALVLKNIQKEKFVKDQILKSKKS